MIDGKHQRNEVNHKVASSASFASGVSDSHTDHDVGPGKHHRSDEIGDLKRNHFFFVLLKFCLDRVIF